MSEIKRVTTIGPYIDAVARQLTRRVCDSYKLMHDCCLLHPSFAGEAALERATDAASELEESAGVMRSFLQAILNARREQSDDMKPDTEQL